MASVEHGEKKRWAKHLMPAAGVLALLLCSFAWIWVDSGGVHLPVQIPDQATNAFLLSWLTVVMLAVAAITAVFFRSERWGFLIVPLTFISGMLLTVALAGATFARLNEDDGPFGTLLAVIGGGVLAVVGTGIGRFIAKLWKAPQQ